MNMKRMGAVAILLGVLGVGVTYAGPIVIDHNCVDVSLIPEDSIAAAASLRVLLRHASVGQGIGWGLDCLAGLKSTQSACKCFPAGKYDRSNWVLEARMGNGRTKIDDLVEQAAARADQFDVFMMKYCYIDALGNSHPDWEYYRSRMEQLEAEYPGKRFVWWTIPLTRDGQPGTDVFNALIRSYCAANGKTLFDIADIECHDLSGVRLTNAQGNETISQQYTQEIHAGHLNIEGRIRVASALWHLMAAVARDLHEPAGPRIIYVDDDAAGANAGSSWNSAYRYLQDALSAADSATKPVEIRVAQGTYSPDRSAAHPHGTRDRMASFGLVASVAIKGGYAGVDALVPDTRNVHLYETILSGDLNGDDHLDATARRGDNSYHVVYATDVDEGAVLDGVIISSGHADGWPSEVNSLPPASGPRPSPRRRDHTIDGAGMYVSQGRPTVMDCVFTDNHAYAEGGALYSLGGCPTLTNCCFAGNSASSGGALFDETGGVTLVNCTLVGNRAQEASAIAYDRPYEIDSTIRLINCILWGAPGHISGTGAAVIAAVGYSRTSAAITVEYSNISGGWPGAGNIDLDPCFADPGHWNANGTPNDANDDVWVGGDYHPKSQAGRWDADGQRWLHDDVTSPCIDAGDPNADWTAELWPHGGRINMGAYGGTAQASMSLSVVGSHADLDHDGAINAKDLLTLADNWLIGVLPHAADIGRDGAVSFRDFARLARRWRLEPGAAQEPLDITLSKRAKWSPLHAGYDPNLPGYRVVGDIASVTLRAQINDLPSRLILAIQTSPGMIAMLEGFTFTAPCIMVNGEPFGQAGLAVYRRADSSRPWQLEPGVPADALFTFAIVGDEVRITFLPAAIELLRMPCKLSWVDWYR